MLLCFECTDSRQSKSMFRRDFGKNVFFSIYWWDIGKFVLLVFFSVGHTSGRSQTIDGCVVMAA